MLKQIRQAGFKGYVNVATFEGAKHWAMGMVRSLALEVALGPVTVNAGGTLGGNGSVSGNVNVMGGTLAAGNSIGGTTADIDSGFGFMAGGEFAT